MFKEQQRNAYQSIRAPQQLHDKIMAAQKPAKRWPKYVTGLVAACLVLVLSASFFFGSSAPGIVINGQRLHESVIYYDLSPASEMRSSPMITVPVELELDKTSRITVSQGHLTGENAERVQELSAKGSVTLFWEIPREEEIPLCEMQIRHGKDVTTITLAYEETQITITKKGE